MFTGYPTEEELKSIREYDIIKCGTKDFLQLISNTWKHSYGTMEVLGKRKIKLYLATGGWSGNEDIIGAMQENIVFWSFFWQRSERGGAYWFKFPLKSGKDE